jgi:hypothetical protein
MDDIAEQHREQAPIDNQAVQTAPIPTYPVSMSTGGGGGLEFGAGIAA